MAESNKPLRSLTGVKPTGIPHIGNYLGAIRPALELSKDYESFLFIADLHALTTQHDPKQLSEQTLIVAATWLAFGLDPKRVVFYKQSDVPETTTLAWILSCMTPLGFLNRAHSFKDVRDKAGEDINHGVYYYPVLMAADILLYDANLVPVGKDQKQHLEITQEIARKFNNAYGEVLVVPEAKIDQSVMTIPGLDGRKMSKSYSNVLDPFAPEKELRTRIKKDLVTNSVTYGDPLPTEGETIFTLVSLLDPARVPLLTRQYQRGRKDPDRPDSELADPSQNYFGWGGAKEVLVETILDRLGPARTEYARLIADKPYLRQLLTEGAEKARTVAERVLKRVTDAVGLVP